MSRSSQDLKVDLIEEVADFQELEDELANLDLKNVFAVDLDSLMHQLWEIRAGNNTAFKNLNNTVMYWALDEEHPFKVAIRRSFTLNKSYSASETQDRLTPIVQYHLHKALKPRKYVALLKNMYATDRTSRNKYIIRSENPRGFKGHISRIAIKENNLLKYFMLQ